MTERSLRIWLSAIRPATLTAAVVPVIVGSAVAARDGRFRALPAVAALLGAVLIQIGTNLANDADDYERGADSAARQGPVRATQSGLLSTRQVRGAAWLSFAGAALPGGYLAAVGGWSIIGLGVAAIAAGLAYTGGPWPYGYHGLGDLFVFAFFGLAAVLGTYYVQTGALSGLAVAAALPVGALATAILVVNNIRDIQTDRLVGKRTLAVRLGDRGARREFAALVTAAYLVPLALWQGGGVSALVLLPWLTLPQAARLVGDVLAAQDGTRFNAALRATARLHGWYGLLFAGGLLA